MKTITGIALVLTFLLVCPNLSSARSMDFELKAGPSSVSGGIHYLTPLGRGYMKFGLTGVISDDDDTSYQWGALQLLVGSDALTPGLRAEVGFKSILGSAEKGIFSGDIGAIAFTGNLAYLFPRRSIPFPLEIFGGLSFAPGPLAFMDLDSYTEVTIGFGIPIIEQASIEVSYHAYYLDMEESPGSWTLNENAVRFGIVMRF